ncbi:MAG: CHAT domain-containing protein [Candidatus Omnitrophota bacterium]
METINQPDPKKPTKKILILAANPKVTPNLRLDEEMREIDGSLKQTRYAHRFHIHYKWAVRTRDLRKALLDCEPHIVHFMGHGKEDGIILEDEIGFPKHISAQAIAGLFKLCTGHVECVILNACYTAIQASEINRYIDYVIGMKREINDKASIEFAVGFYEALGSGKSIEDAFDFGCSAIHAAFPDIPEHLIPVLKVKPNTVNIRILLETTGDAFDYRLSLDERTTAIKNSLIDRLQLPRTSDNGETAIYYLLNKTTDQLLDDSKTLRENNVRDKDIFVFLEEINEN